MRFLLAPDKFKGSLTAVEVCDRLSTGIRRVEPESEIDRVPVADGGEGTLDVLLEHGFRCVGATVADSLNRPRRARLGVRGSEAIVELAEADGLRHIQPDARDALAATSRGLGDLIARALDEGCRTLVIALGGSANTDGGAGMVQALGARILDEDGHELGSGGGCLHQVASVDLSGMDPRLRDVSVVVASDVDNPLLGPRGTASVYAPQKGAGPDEVALLERGLERWADVAAAATGRRAADRAGAGAAGGVGFALMTFLAGTVRSGIEVVLEEVGFEERLSRADLVVTGEGSIDEQTLHGKAPTGVAAAAARHGIPCVAVSGRCTLAPQDLRRAGFAHVYALIDRADGVEDSLARAGWLVEEIGATIAHDRARRPLPPPQTTEDTGIEDRRVL